MIHIVICVVCAAFTDTLHTCKPFLSMYATFYIVMQASLVKTLSSATTWAGLNSRGEGLGLNSTEDGLD